MAIFERLLQSVVLAGYGMISRTREGVVDGSLDVVEVLERSLSLSLSHLHKGICMVISTERSTSV